MMLLDSYTSKVLDSSFAKKAGGLENQQVENADDVTNSEFIARSVMKSKNVPSFQAWLFFEEWQSGMLGNVWYGNYWNNKHT